MWRLFERGVNLRVGLVKNLIFLVVKSFFERDFSHTYNKNGGILGKRNDY